MIVVSPIQEKILTSLGKYKFLTSQQALTLVGNKSIQTIYNEVRALRERGFLDSVIYGGVSKTGTLAKFHYLTPKGAKIVADIESVILDKVKFPKSTNTLVKNDFFHRIYTIDLMIAYDRWIHEAGHDPLFFDVYFDKIGSQRRQDEGALKGKTRVDIGKENFIDPDGIFAFRTIQKEQLYVLEVANGLDTKRIIQQIRNVIFACYQGHISEKYQIKVTPKLLVAFEHPSTLKSVQARAKQDEYLDNFDGLDDYLFLGLQSEIKEAWHSSWQNIHGKKVRIWNQ